MDFDTVSSFPRTMIKKGRKPIYLTDEDRKEAQRRYSRSYFYRNQEAVTMKVREYKNNNREKIREQARNYYHNRKDKDIN